jgi:hypothetical protein
MDFSSLTKRLSKLVKMAEMVRKKWEVYRMWQVLTGHPLGYLARLVKILFQLDILSRKFPRRGNVRTSSISAVSSSIVVDDEPQIEIYIKRRDVIQVDQRAVPSGTFLSH